MRQIIEVSNVTKQKPQTSTIAKDSPGNADTMDSFLKHPLPLTLVDNARQHTTWFAKVFDGDPRALEEEEQKQWHQQFQKAFQKTLPEWGQDLPKIRTAFQKAIDTESKPFESLTLMFDTEGAFLLVTYKKPASGSTPNTTVTTLLSTLLPKHMLDTVLKDLKPLDELDKERITSMHTLAEHTLPTPTTTQPKETDAATLELLRSTGASLTEKISAFAEDVAPEDDEPCNTLALLNNVPTILATRQKEQSKFWILRAWERMTLSKIGAPEESGDDLAIFGRRTRCWETWNSLRQQHNTFTEDAAPQLQIANLKSDTTDFEAFKETVLQTTAHVLASAGLVSLTYRRCYKVERRELLILKRLSQTPTFVEFFRVVSTLIEGGQLATPTSNKQRSELKLFCLNLLKKANPTANTETLTVSERLTIAITLGRESHLCPCGKPGNIAFPKASWDWLDKNADIFAYEAFCSQDCLKHHRPRYCPKCFQSDQLLDVQSTLLPYAAKPQPIFRCSRCGVYERRAVHPNDAALALGYKKAKMDEMRRSSAQAY